jgi:hypothetical protein
MAVPGGSGAWIMRESAGEIGTVFRFDCAPPVVAQRGLLRCLCLHLFMTNINDRHPAMPSSRSDEAAQDAHA